MSSSAAEHRGADEELVRAYAAELTALGAALGAAHGIHALRFASPGRLVGRVDPDRDALDMAEFAAEAERLLGADVSLLSDAVLNKPKVSPDLVSARHCERPETARTRTPWDGLRKLRNEFAHVRLPDIDKDKSGG